MSSYRPNYGAPPPPPPRDLPPLPYGPPPYRMPSNGPFQFGPPQYGPHSNGQLENSGYGGHPGNLPLGPQRSLPQTDFSFRNEASAPKYPPNADNYRPAPNNRPSTNGNSRQDRRGPRQGGRPFRGRGPKVMPSARPLLQQRGGGDDDEQSLGVDLQMQKYLPIGDISESDDDQEQESLSPSTEDKNIDGTGDNNGEPPAKRRELISNGVTDGESAPKWSNPDPYSVLPPVEDVHRKRKDPVAFIRKGIKSADEKATMQNQVMANDDFISFEDNVDEVTVSTESRPESRASPIRTVLDISDHPGQFPDPSADDDPSLGSRKRTFDDHIKPGRRVVNKELTQQSGSLLEAWIPPRAGEAIPWFCKETSSILSPGFRLHREICDFFEFVKPQPHEHHVRQALLSRLQTMISGELPNCTVHCFGSFAAGLYLPNADMDIVINSNQFNATGRETICQSRKLLYKFGDYIRASRMAEEGSVEVIAKAKVPIIKFVDRLTALKVDVSFENKTGIAANDTFSVWKRQFPAAPVLVAIIKQFLMMRGLNEVQFGGLGGFSVTCLVVSLLQNMPRIQARSLIPEENLGEILIEFLDLYGNRIDINRTGIMMNPPGYFDKARDRLNFRSQGYKIDKLAIIDPNRPENDISGGSKRVSLIFERFSRAHAELMKAMKTQDRPSLLDWMLGGNYESFMWHRARLQKVYDNKDIESLHLQSQSVRLPNDQMLIDVQKGSARKRVNSLLAAMRRGTGPEPHTPTVPDPPTKTANNISGFEAWIARSGLRTFQEPTPKKPRDSLDSDFTCPPHLLVGKPTIFANTAPPSTPGAYGVSNSRPRRISNDRPHHTSKSNRMASPSSERRREVTEHFSGCSSNYPIEVD